jgi:aquaporin Z
VTLTFLRLGKIAPRDAGFYVLAQFLGAAAGILIAVALVHGIAADPSVNYVATLPGSFGNAAAFAGELAISFLMMTMILVISNAKRLARFTGIVAACLIALYITVEAPLSGMSMNPARSFAPALASGSVGSLWIYFLAPPVGMLLAAELYVHLVGYTRVRCAKLHHPASGPCLFNCDSGRQA